MVNTATIQQIHSTTKYHEPKVTPTNNTIYTYTFCFRNTSTGKAGQTFAPFAQPHRGNKICHQLCCPIKKLIHVLILLLTKYPNQENKKKRSPHLLAIQRPGFHFLFNLVGQYLNYTHINLLPGSPRTSPTASHHIPMLYTSPVLIKY